MAVMHFMHTNYAPVDI